MFLRIALIAEKKLVGQQLKMSFAGNRTAELWQSFMPGRNKIKHRVSDDLISLQDYGNAFDFKNFNPENEFIKWAAAEVSEFTGLPETMEAFTLPAGTYAVFFHKGAGPTAAKTFQYIFNDWLPASEYILDSRPHFEVLGAGYKNNHPSSEEEIWIPVKLKQ